MATMTKSTPTLEAYERALSKALDTRPAIQFVDRLADETIFIIAASAGEGSYTVHSPAEDCMTCNCPAGQRAYPCKHKGAALLHELADAFQDALDVSIASAKCKACEKRPAGATGLCSKCEAAQRKQEQPRSCQWAEGQWESYQTARWNY